jgi:hypothetical protein
MENSAFLVNYWKALLQQITFAAGGNQSLQTSKTFLRAKFRDSYRPVCGWHS